ncbi:hypothetical protein ACFWIB_17000 [Streptomyces sp. NPDC127051]|uniref:hypothetical protein n=1 Tax=Streptomyces sp. NPDC127051 TaxID=3347119 RepID=UPI00364B3648
MAYETSRRIMAKMRGTNITDEAAQDPPDPIVDPATLALWRQAGSPSRTDRTREAQRRESQRVAQEVADAAIERRVILTAQGEGISREVARALLDRQQAQADEQALRRRVHEQMLASNRAEKQAERERWERRANKPMQSSREPEPGAPYLIPGGSTAGHRDRTSERLMAQANGTVWALYQQEQGENG